MLPKWAQAQTNILSNKTYHCSLVQSFQNISQNDNYFTSFKYSTKHFTKYFTVLKLLWILQNSLIDIHFLNS